MRLAVLVLLVALGAGCKRERDRSGGPLALSAPEATRATADGGAPSVDQGHADPGPPPESTGRSLVENNCLSCHTEDLLSQQRLTAPQWAKVVKKMHGWGAPLAPTEIEPLTAYLAARYGLSTGPAVLPTLSAADAARALDPLPDGPFAGGDAGRGRALFHDRCAPCHAEDGRGAAVGVNLVDRPLLYRAVDFAREVRAGRGRMPGFEDTRDGEVADLLACLRSLSEERRGR